MKWNNEIFEKVANGIKRAVDFVINVLLFIPRMVLKGFKKLIGRAEDANAEEFDEDAEEPDEEKNEEVVVEDKKDDEPEQKSSEVTTESKDDSKKEVKEVVEDKKEVNSESKAEETSKDVVVEDKKDYEAIAAASEPKKEIVKAEVVDTETGTVIETVDTAISEEDKKKSQNTTNEEQTKHAKKKVNLPEEELRLNNIMSQSINNLRIDVLHGYKGYFSSHAHDFAKSFLNVIGFKAGKVNENDSDQFYYGIIRDMENGSIDITNRNNKTKTIEIDSELSKMLRNAIDNIPIFFDYDMGNVFKRFDECFINFVKGAYDIVQSGNGEIYKKDATDAVA